MHVSGCSYTCKYSFSSTVVVVFFTQHSNVNISRHIYVQMTEKHRSNCWKDSSLYKKVEGNFNLQILKGEVFLLSLKNYQALKIVPGIFPAIFTDSTLYINFSPYLLDSPRWWEIHTSKIPNIPYYRLRRNNTVFVCRWHNHLFRKSKRLDKTHRTNKHL